MLITLRNNNQMFTKLSENVIIILLHNLSCQKSVKTQREQKRIASSYRNQTQRALKGTFILKYPCTKAVSNVCYSLAVVTDHQRPETKQLNSSGFSTPNRSFIGLVDDLCPDEDFSYITTFIQYCCGT